MALLNGCTHLVGGGGGTYTEQDGTYMYEQDEWDSVSVAMSTHPVCWLWGGSVHGMSSMALGSVHGKSRTVLVYSSCRVAVIVGKRRRRSGKLANRK